MKLSELYNDIILEQDNPKLIQSSYFSTIPDWFNYYNSVAYDSDYMYMVVYQGGRILEEPKEKWEKLLRASLKRNEYTLNNLYRTIIQDYDPISNYDKNSTITTTKSGKEITTDFGTTDIDYNGSEKDTLEKTGSENNSHVGEEIITNYESAFDAWQDGNNIIRNKQKTDFGGNSGIQDNLTFTNRKDESTKTFNGRNDSTSVDMEHKTEFENRNDVVVEHTSGNIGTMTTAMMLTSERELSMFRFLDKLYEILIDDICTYEWECDL